VLGGARPRLDGRLDYLVQSPATDLLPEMKERYRDRDEPTSPPHIAPYGHDLASTFMSERMDFEKCSRFHPLYLNDYSSFCLKVGLR